MTTQHTPGPWMVECLGSTMRVIDAQGDDLILVGDAFRKYHYADAVLMAASPALLAACESAAVLLDALAPGSHVAAECRAAIAAAKGETTP